MDRKFLEDLAFEYKYNFSNEPGEGETDELLQQLCSERFDKIV